MDAACYIEMQIDGQSAIFGVGIDRNITSAAIKAIFNGLNRHLEASVPAVEEEAIFAATT